jgi:hypothetical protein
MDTPENPNPIVAMAMRIRARKEIETAVDAAATPASASDLDAESGLAAFGEGLRVAAKRLNAILGKNGVTFVRLEKPLRLRVRFRDKRVSLDLDAARQLVLVKGDDLDGEYQFDTGSATPSLINLSHLSTEAGYGEPLTPARVIKTVARDAELPPPAHLQGPGPLSF